MNDTCINNVYFQKRLNQKTKKLQNIKKLKNINKTSKKSIKMNFGNQI